MHVRAQPRLALHILDRQWSDTGTVPIAILLQFFSSIYEIPKYLLGCKRDAKVFAVAQNIAARNKTTTWLTVSHLKAVDTRPTDGRTIETSTTEPKRVVQVSVRPKIEPGIARLVMGVGPMLHCPELPTYGEFVADCDSMTCCERVPGWYPVLRRFILELESCL